LPSRHKFGVGCPLRSPPPSPTKLRKRARLLLAGERPEQWTSQGRHNELYRLHQIELENK